ncbi:MAG: sigma-70 family RNA polymerase sigma factor [Anaerolinea sp.]|nr:sigma-70 family RNA polymerase sigma factor [Anaerolinea sp.]
MVKPQEERLDDALSDMEAVARAAGGDTAAFSVLYERYVNRIYNYIFYRTGVPHEAEDLTERVFDRAFGHIGNYRPMGLPFSAWLYRIAHNLVANWHRDNSRRREVPLDSQDYLVQRTDGPELAMMQGQELETLLSAIRTLSEERQHLLVLKFVEDLSNAEIAVIMGRSEGAVKSLYHRTLLALRDALEQAKQTGG